MADTDWEFVFDGVVGYLTSPIWQIPVMNFIEKNCIVFDPSEENCLPWGEIHKKYKNLVEDLLSSYLKDVGIEEEQFVQACGTPSLQNRPQLQAVFEQIWAAEDFEIFKRIMVQRNIELELQALELIKQQQKQKENQKEKQTAVLHVDQQKLQQIEDEKNEKGIESYEESILQEVLRKSREEYEEAAKGKEKDSTDVEKHYRETHESNIKILKEKAEEKRKEMKQFVAVRVTETNPEDGAGVFSKDQAPPLSEAACEQRKNSPAKNIVPSQPSTVVSKFPEQESVANATDAATSWLQNAKAEYASCNKDQSISSSVMAENEDLKRREQYLKDQRDRLLKLKNKERKKQLDSYSASQPKRPTSARVAREAVTSGLNEAISATNEADSSKLAVRKALADKLKKEVIYK